MSENAKIAQIIEKLEHNIPFGLFEQELKCYFKDGTQVRYTHLWQAIKIHKNIPEGKNPGSLYDLFPNTFFGANTCKFNRFDWKKKSIIPDLI